jgi:hypothetical protein
VAAPSFSDLLVIEIIDEVDRKWRSRFGTIQERSDWKDVVRIMRYDVVRSALCPKETPDDHISMLLFDSIHKSNCVVC